MPGDKLAVRSISPHPERRESYDRYSNAQRRMEDVKDAGFGVYIVLGFNGISLHIVDHKRLGWDNLPKRREE